ncbi:MAG: phosphoglycerate kinase [Gammaproteobacteria bacterium]|nr:phosphoglycerate kinase [Gammaproteobacteria bacterium]
MASADGFTVIGGGDTVTAATKFIDLKNIDYVCTGGGAMIQYLSGQQLPLINSLEKAFKRDSIR